MAKTRTNVWAVAIALFVSANSTFAQRTISLRGQVTDQFASVIVGASVTLADQNGKQQTTQTDDQGGYRFNELVPERMRCEQRKPALRPMMKPA